MYLVRVTVIGSDLLILCLEEWWEKWDWIFYSLFPPIIPNLVPLSRLVTHQSFSRLLGEWSSCKRRAFGVSSQFMGGVVSLIVFFSPCTCISILGVVSSFLLGHNISVGLHWHSSGHGLDFHLNSLRTLPGSSGPIHQSVYMLHWSVFHTLIPPNPNDSDVLLSMLSSGYLGLKKWLQMWLVSPPSLLLTPKKAVGMTHDCCLWGWGASHGPAARFTSIHAIPEGSGRAAVLVSMASPHLSIFSFSASLLAAVTQTAQVLDTYLRKLLLASAALVSTLAGSEADDLFPSVPHLFLFTAVIGWKHVKKG